MAMTTWRLALARAMAGDGDEEYERHPWPPDSGPIIACTLDDAGLDATFDDGYGGHCGVAFTAWTPTRVYFPIVYDSAEWVGSAPRDPSSEAMRHQGGE